MKILLDENFPLPLYHRLRTAGYEAEHIIVLGQRGLPDAVIRARLAGEELLFLTQDTEFEDLPRESSSDGDHLRIPQSLLTKQRVEIWFTALEHFLARKPAGKLFDSGRKFTSTRLREVAFPSMT